MKRAASFWTDVRWQVIGNATAQAIGVLGMPLLTRLYKPEDFAANSIFLQFAMFFAGVMTWRFEYFVQLPNANAGAQGLVRLTWLLGAVGAASLTPIVWGTTHFLPTLAEQQALVEWLWLSPLTAALISISLAYQHRVQRWGRFKLSGAGEVVAKLGYIGFGTAAGWIGAGALGLVSTTAAGTGSKLACHLLLAPREDARSVAVQSIRAWWDSAMTAARMHWRMATSMLLSHLFGTVTGLAPILFIGYRYGSSLLGQYSLVTLTIFLPASLIGNAIGQVFYQRAAQRWSSGDSIHGLWRETTLRLTLIGAPIHLLVALCSPWLYPAIFGEQWHDAGKFAVGISVAAFFAFVSTPMERCCLIVGKGRYMVGWHGARAVTTVLVIGMAYGLDLGFSAFLATLVLQMSSLYLFDLLAEGHFSQIQPVSAVRDHADMGADA